MIKQNKSKLNTTAKDFIWNTIASLIFSAVSMVLSLIVINIIGTEIGGIFSFGYSTLAYIVFTISYFGMRNFQIVDIRYKYSFNEYLSLRVLTCFAGLIFGIIYIGFLFITNIYDLNKSIMLFLIILYGSIEAFFDVYECELQRIGKLYKAGIALFFRTIFFTSTLIIILYFTKNVFFAIICSLIAKVVTALYFDIYVFNNEIDGEYKISINLIDKKIFDLLKETLPLFLIIIFDSYIYSSSKFAVDVLMTDYHNGLFNLLFLPSNVIYLLCSTAIRPILTPLSHLYHSDKNEYEKTCKYIYKIISIIAVILLVFGILLSKVYLYIIDILSNGLYTANLRRGVIFSSVIFIIIGGIFYSVYAPGFNMLIIESKIKYMLKIYIPIFVLSMISSYAFVNQFAILGASISFALLMIILSGSLLFAKFKK